MGERLGLCQVSKLLQYSPLRRYSALQALTHPFFDELREGTTTLPNGAQPPLSLSFPPSEHDPSHSTAGPVRAGLEWSLSEGA